MQISSSADSPPLFYISTHRGFSSKPSIVLHSGPNPSLSPLASAQFRSFSSTIDIEIGQRKYSLLRNIHFSSGEFFNLPVKITGKMERFEWKPSSGKEVESLQGRGKGMKLVRVGLGEAVAAWARPNSGIRKKAKLRFMARQRGELDDEWEVMAVISIAAIVENSRRGSSAGGGGGGGSGGGGGC